MTQDRDALIEAVKRNLFAITKARLECQSWLRSRPIISSSFGPIGAHQATLAYTRCGLDAVWHLIVLPDSGLTLCIESSAERALELARSVVDAVGHARLLQWSAEIKAERPVKTHEEAPSAVGRPLKVRSIARRRREIFEKSGGHCYYCNCHLQLDGKWHVEHKLPRAMGGDNHPDNLTAACVACNLSKRDLTDVEFLQKQSVSKA